MMEGWEGKRKGKKRVSLPKGKKESSAAAGGYKKT